MIEVVTGLFVLFGAFFALAAGLGLLRLPDVLIRMHAGTKAGTLGCGLILVGCAIYFGALGITAQVVVTIIFLLLTAPIAAHMIGRAALVLGVELWKTKDMTK